MPEDKPSELTAFADWFKQRYQDVKHFTTEKLVAEFKREQQIREDNEATGR
jgi:hypothetical protein